MSDMMNSPFAQDANETTPLSRLCGAIVRVVSLALVFFTPLFFLPWAVDVVEFNKQLLLFVGVTIIGLAWLGKTLLEKRFTYQRSFVNIFVILILLATLASAWFSESRYMSIVGDFGQEMAGFSTALVLAVLYFVLTSTFRDERSLKQLLTVTVGGGFFTALFALLQGLHVYVFPFDFAKLAAFNTIGTASALGVYLAFIVTLCGTMLMTAHGENNGKKEIAKKLALVVTAALALFLIVTIDFNPVTWSLLCGSAILIVCAFVHAKSAKGVASAVLPIVALAVAVLLLIFHSPVKLDFASEVMPSMATSADIAQKILRERPFLGSGPGTFIFDYARFHPESVNRSEFWNIRFDRGASHLVTSLATTGFVGTLSWALLVLSLLFVVSKKILRTSDEQPHLLFGVFAAWATLVVARCLYSSNVTLEFVFWFATAALLIAYQKKSTTVTFEKSPHAAMLVSFLFIAGLIFSSAGLFVEGQRYAAEIAYMKAVSIDRAHGSPDDVVNGLQHAVELNGRNNAYLRNLALAYLARADATLAAAPRMDQKPGERKQDYDVRVAFARQEQIKTVSGDTVAAVNTAKAATAMEPKNVAAWSVLASIYARLMGVTDGADDWALKSFQSVLELEPNNPSTHTEIGKVYVFQSDQAKQEAAALKDDQAKKDAQKKSDDALENAVDEFTKAIALKSDYAPAHYNLALVYDRQGKLKDAIKKMESIIPTNAKDVGLGFQLALLYYRDGRKDDAIRMLEAVVRLSPNYSNAMWYLAAMYEEKGKIDGAVALLTKVKELNPGNDLVTQRLNNLSRKRPIPAGLPLPVEQSPQNQPSVKK